MRFTKMHGLGNDYVYVSLFDQAVVDPAALARKVSDRHRGIGSDGLILIGPSTRADVRMEMYNADGSRAQMCGNGIRCVAKYAVEHGLATPPTLNIETDDGIKIAQCHMNGGRVEAVRIDMGEPRLHPSMLPCALSGERIVDREVVIDGETFRITCVSMGNPHAVIFVDDVRRCGIERFGPIIERDALFPQRVNVHAVRVDARDHVTMRTWERGAGLTQACGTGACAVCVASRLNGWTDRVITATLPGGDLLLEWGADNHVYKTGPAVEVFSGEWRDGA